MQTFTWSRTLEMSYLSFRMPSAHCYSYLLTSSWYTPFLCSWSLISDSLELLGSRLDPPEFLYS